MIVFYKDFARVEHKVLIFLYIEFSQIIVRTDYFFNILVPCVWGCFAIFERDYLRISICGLDTLLTVIDVHRRCRRYHVQGLVILGLHRSIYNWTFGVLTLPSEHQAAWSPLFLTKLSLELGWIQQIMSIQLYDSWLCGLANQPVWLHLENYSLKGSNCFLGGTRDQPLDLGFFYMRHGILKQRHLLDHHVGHF